MAATLQGVAAMSGEPQNSKAAAVNGPLEQNFIVIFLPIVTPSRVFVIRPHATAVSVRKIDASIPKSGLSAASDSP